MSKPLTSLSLKQLRVPVFLGVTSKERAEQQLVKIDLKLIFRDLPRACATDRLEDTLCYATLASNIRQFCSTKVFHLIEHLGYQLYQFIKQSLAGVDINLCIHKNPPIEGLDGSIFCISDHREVCQ